MAGELVAKGLLGALLTLSVVGFGSASLAETSTPAASATKTSTTTTAPTASTTTTTAPATPAKTATTPSSTTATTTTTTTAAPVTTSTTTTAAPVTSTTTTAAPVTTSTTTTAAPVTSTTTTAAPVTSTATPQASTTTTTTTGAAATSTSTATATAATTTTAPTNYALSLPNACHSESVVIAEYLGYEKADDIRWNQAPLADYKIVKILKGPPLNHRLPIKYEFHDHSNPPTPKGWKFSDKEMPEKGSRWLIFIDHAVPHNNMFETYEGNYGRQPETEDNLNKVYSLLGNE